MSDEVTVKHDIEWNLSIYAQTSLLQQDGQRVPVN
jgi:hypothetical protein